MVDRDMPVKIDSVDCAPITLDEYVTYIESSVDFRDRESILASSSMLQRLAANDCFLGDRMVAELCSGEPFQVNNAYNYQSFLLRVTDSYLLRANFWVPPSHLHRHGERAASAFGYDAYHNHNFDLLTVGYWGGGYETEMYRMLDPYYPLEIGDIPDLEGLGRWHLGRGDVMFYDAFSDVHCQHAPHELSVSINLMTHSTRDTWPQYIFDARDLSISAMVGSPLDARIHLLTMARHIEPEESIRILEYIANRDPAPRLRKLARDALADRFTNWQ